MQGEQSPATRRRWWQAMPPPDVPVVSARRAYVEVVAVFGAIFGASVANAVLLLTGRLETDMMGYSWSRFGPAAFQDMARIGIVAAVVLLLAQRRGCSPAALGIKLHRDGEGRAMGWRELRVAAWAVLALLVSGAVTAVLKTGGIPAGPPTAASLTYMAAHSIDAGFVEELVVLAFLITTLRQARRPLPEIAAIALLCRVSYHLYYGPGALGILMWAGVFVWLYLRTRNLWPLILVHCGWDLMATFTRKWHAVGGIGLLMMLGLLIVAPISWLVERAALKPAAPTWRPPPGWHPDPSGHHVWRWWDGHGWTPTVSEAWSVADESQARSVVRQP